MSSHPESVSSSADATAKSPDESPDLAVVAESAELAGATPPDPTPLPLPGEDGTYDLGAPECYLNRELTWLNFNFRVLHEARDPRTPLLERLKFIAIVGSNLDEFFMKRIGGLKQQVGAGVQTVTVDGRTPREQINACYTLVRRLEREKRAVAEGVLSLLEEHEIRVSRCASLPKKDRKWLRDYYVENIFPLVTPQATDPAHPFPFVSNLSLNLLVTLRHPGEPEIQLARVKVPVGAGIPRLLRVQDRFEFVPLEDVMADNLDLLFPDMEIQSCELFRVTRNANTETDEERADDLLAMIESELRERRFAPIVRLEVIGGMDPVHRGMLASELDLDEHDDVFELEGMPAMRDLIELAALDRPEHHDPPHRPIDHPDLLTERNVFHVLRDSPGILLTHPYENFSTSVGRFLREASTDPKVRAIKMALYRTSADSNIVDHLVAAARNGKQVAVVVELKARFDEQANITWANRLEEAGIHVTYGVVGLKTHCKVILVVRRDYNGLHRYAHIGTGNYHAGTARIYSDFGLLTGDTKIGEDLTELFNYLTTGYKPRRRYRKILPAPKVLKRELLEKIQREIDGHGEDSPGLIRMQMNALEDQEITAALYRASQAGVKVELLVRDTCRLRPGIPGLSENVTVVSVVGRFLEHSRLVYFRNGGAEEFYIGSADSMKRNLESRVEVMAPIEPPELRKQLAQVLDAQINDARNGWVMQSDGSYRQRVPGDEGKTLGSQVRQIRWAEARLKKSTRLRRRRPRGIGRRNLG